MIIHSQAVKIKHPDYYRKKYWDKNLTKRDELSKDWWNEVSTDYLDAPMDGCDTNMVYTIDSIKPHFDFPKISYLLILHNCCYQFQCGRELCDINPGDVVEFDLMVEHGITKVKPGRNLFLALAIDVDYGISVELETIKNFYKPYI